MLHILAALAFLFVPSIAVVLCLLLSSSSILIQQSAIDIIMRNLWLSVLVLVTTGISSVAADAACGHIPPPHHGGPGRHHRLCPVKAEGNGQDDSKNILEAIHKCNNGGRVWFKKGEQYTIGTALDLSFMNNVDLGKLMTSKCQSMGTRELILAL